MEIEKNYRMNSLFEFYGPLLTDKQHAYLALYYGDDYSLGEIATEFNVSRQAVYDNIRRTEASWKSMSRNCIFLPTTRHKMRRWMPWSAMSARIIQVTRI